MWSLDLDTKLSKRNQRTKNDRRLEEHQSSGQPYPGREQADVAGKGDRVPTLGE
jgi:hypothetical protein